ncbi:MAG: UvrD-helicase domain-containing protein [Spirochaetaceae bacterium]|jgi:ATP-dependent helicase/nuclease subunit A|nr:UvrD-helicase domain-containing protein [Spirochaetaceae bacterium]
MDPKTENPVLPCIGDLDDEQRRAATALRNVVVSAGAGSGKTRVLAARYGWLIMTGRCKTEEILTITFTNKAANEMYRRIYRLLAESAEDPDPLPAFPARRGSSETAPSPGRYAREAVKNFYKARIVTLDSFCASVARALCSHFGISPDFTSDDLQVRDMARSLALRFVLDNRDNPALQRLIAEKKLRGTADELFILPVLYHSPISRPLDFSAFERIQREELCRRWKEYTLLLADIAADLRRSLPDFDPPRQGELAPVLSSIPGAPDIEPLFVQEEGREELLRYLGSLEKLKALGPRKTKNETEPYTLLREAIGKIKGTLYPRLEAVANHVLQWDIVRSVFPLIQEYQDLLNRKKRETGILTFNDIAHLAVDGLRMYPGIRRVYKTSFKAVMIDEFQDNNSLQRDLVALLAENEDRLEQGLPAPGQLAPGKVFYVGDEKQSIYRFRGADVSVFRGLAAQTGHSLGLSRNYRSHPMLIRAFNLIFGGRREKDGPEPGEGVFLPGAPADYEAVYHWVYHGDEKAADTPAAAAPARTGAAAGNDAAGNDAAGNAAAGNAAAGKEEPRLHFAFFDEGRLEETAALPQGEDYEALYIARKIKTLVLEGAPVFDRGTKKQRPCRYGDFALLQRSYTRQHILERALKLFAVPFSADRPAALFKDAPVNDLWALLKLLVYPGDRIAYGSLLRSPFVRLGEDAFTLCMLEDTPAFDEALDAKLPPEDRERYREARRCYRELLGELQDLPVSSLLTKLWYEYGYRHEALWSRFSQAYLDLYDLVFEQARTIEARGKGLVEFLDYLEDAASGKEKPGDSVLPAVDEGGVRLMSIHRCKGLEFPIVFLYGCGCREDTAPDQGLSLFSRRWGVSLRLPRTGELPGAEDYFYLEEKEDHKRKTLAELRRLLYVAMTRAESGLYLTAGIPKQNKAEREQLDPRTFACDKDFIVERREQYRTRTDLESISFLQLLPALRRDDPLYTVESIYAYSSQELRSIVKTLEGGSGASAASMKERARRVQGEYESTPGFSSRRFGPQTIAASALPGAGLQGPARSGSQAGSANPALEALLKRTGLGERDFGTIVHGFIESRFNRRPPRIPRRFSAAVEDKEKLALLAEEARIMADKFFDSALGRRAQEAAWRETEYPVLTVLTLPAAEHAGSPGPVTVMGKIDLLFEQDSQLYVVDFKTGRDDDISRHLGQMAVYKRAVEDIFKKPALCRLFYLRNAYEADLSPDLAALSPEDLAARWKAQALSADSAKTPAYPGPA